MIQALWRSAHALVHPGGGRGRLSIFIFHRVPEQKDPMLPGEPDAAEFDMLIGWISDLYRVLPLSEAVDRLADGTLPARAAAITFDDGYLDNLEIAAPILRKHGACATLFIATDAIERGIMWNDLVIDALRNAPDEIKAPWLDKPVRYAGPEQIDPNTLTALKYRHFEERMAMADTLP